MKSSARGMIMDTNWRFRNLCTHNKFPEEDSHETCLASFQCWTMMAFSCEILRQLQREVVTPLIKPCIKRKIVLKIFTIWLEDYILGLKLIHERSSCHRVPYAASLQSKSSILCSITQIIFFEKTVPFLCCNENLLFFWKAQHFTTTTWARSPWKWSNHVWSAG